MNPVQLHTARDHPDSIFSILRQLIPLATCNKAPSPGDTPCQGRMGPVRVHEGSSRENRHKRGRIVQTVRYVVHSSYGILTSNDQCTSCYWTYSHANSKAYDYVQIRSFTDLFAHHTAGQNVQFDLDHVIPLNPPLAADPLPVGRAVCVIEECVHRNGNRVYARQDCIARMCQYHCLEAYREAMASNTSRGRCGPHKINAVSSALLHSTGHSGTQMISMPGSTHAATQPIPSQSTLVARSQVPAPPIMPSSTPTYQASQNHIPVQAPSSGMPPSQPRSQRAPNRQVPLSQPLGQEWSIRRHSEAQALKNEMSSLKQRKQVLNERSKRVMKFIVYYEVCIY